MPSPRTYRNLTGLLFVFAVVSLGLASYTYRIDNTPVPVGSDLNSSDYGDAITNWDGIAGSLDNQIAQLQSLYSSSSSGPMTVQYQSSIYQAQLVAPSVQQRVAQLDGERLRLQQEMSGQVRTEGLDGSFFYGTAVSSYYYIADGVYANVDSETVHNASVTFTFYSRTGFQGTVLCTLNYRLGDVVSHAIITLGQIVCGRNPGTTLGSVGFQFKWTG